MASLSHFNITLNEETFTKDVPKLVKSCLPRWKANEIQYTPYEGGKLNILLRCYRTAKPQKAIVIRIWTDRLEGSSLGNRKDETKYVQALSDSGCFPRLIATFNNGYCYECYEGKAMNLLPRLIEEPFMNAVTKAMVKCHMTNVPTIAKKVTFYSKLIEGLNKTSDGNFHKLRQIYPNIPTRAQLLDDIRKVENKFKEMNNTIVLCHGDCHLFNFLWNDVDDHAKMIDCDVIQFNYQGYDIGYHFMSFQYDFFFEGQVMPMPLEEYMRSFAKYFLHHWFIANGRNPEDVSEEKIERFIIEGKVGMIAATLSLICYCLSVIHLRTMIGDLDLNDFFARRCDFYNDKKEEYLSLTSSNEQ